MTLIDVEPQTTTPSDDVTPVQLASWPARAGALTLDILPGAAVLATTVLVAPSVPLRGGWWWGCVCISAVAMLWTGFNRLLAPSLSGYSVGRATFGIVLVRRDGSTVGVWRLLLRDVAHLLDTGTMFAGWLWPLWDSRRRTFADMLVRTESHVVESLVGARARRQATALVVTAASLCALGATVSYTAVHQQDRRIAAASFDVAAQGPQMVEQTLSYHPETLQSDFDRARSLASDAYREELTAQHRAIQMAGPVRNEFWVTNSSLLSSAADRATMLLFLQGQRGASPHQRYITASVRVTFVRSGSGSWLIDNLAVVSKPQVGEATP